MQHRKRNAVVAELAYAHDSGSCEHYAREGSSPSNCTSFLISGSFFCAQKRTNPLKLPDKYAILSLYTIGGA